MSVPMAMEVRTLADATLADWDAFVQTHPEATFFHRAGWKEVIERSFGHRCYFLCAIAGGKIRGVLPLVHIKSHLVGSGLISTAFCVYGGPLAMDEAAREALDLAAGELASKLGVGYLEYRLRQPSQLDWFCDSQLYATFRRPLAPDPDANLLAVPRKRRAEIRKALQLDLKSQLDDGTERFYRLYAESTRNLGTPVFARRYFQNLLATFRPACVVLTVSQGGRALSSVLSFYFRDEVLPYYAGGAAEARALPAHDFMYWELMRRASERGFKLFDFGRSKRGTGAFAYKKNWGFEPQPLYHYYRLMTRRDVPAVHPLNPRYRPLVALWRRLPLWAANRVGPPIARHLG